MNLGEKIDPKSLDLPPEKAQQVIDCINSLKAPPSKTSISLRNAFEASGLIGCLETNEQLSTTYKEKFSLAGKQGIHPY